MPATVAWHGWKSDASGRFVVHAASDAHHNSRTLCGATLPYWAVRLDDVDVGLDELDLPADKTAAVVCVYCMDAASRVDRIDHDGNVVYTDDPPLP